VIVCDVCGHSMDSHPPCYNDPFDAGGVVGGPVLMCNDGPPEEIKPPPV